MVGAGFYAGSKQSGVVSDCKTVSVRWANCVRYRQQGLNISLTKYVRDDVEQASTGRTSGNNSGVPVSSGGFTSQVSTREEGSGQSCDLRGSQASQGNFNSTVVGVNSDSNRCGTREDSSYRSIDSVRIAVEVKQGVEAENRGCVKRKAIDD